MTVITAEGLSKSFMGKTVPDQVSFAIDEGEVSGFPGLLVPTSGTARVPGNSLPETPMPAIGLAYCPETPGFLTRPLSGERIVTTIP